MTTSRIHSRATLLGDGTVLVAGGLYRGSTYLASAELYHSGTNTWSSVPSMAIARWGYAAVLLPNGNAIVTGGIHNGTPLVSSEICDSFTPGWAPGGSKASDVA